MLICIAGKNNIAVNALSYLINKVHYPPQNILVLPNSTDKGIDGFQKSLKKYALEHNIKLTSIIQCYKIKDLIFISLEFNKIINPKLFLSDNLFNLHFSLLPEYKGMYTSVFPILHGKDISGVTLHKIDSGIDTGELIAQNKFKININDTCKNLYLKYLKYGFKLFKENIEFLISGDYNTNPQPHIGSTYYSVKSIDFDNIKIDFNKTSFEIHNQIRAYIFDEYQLPHIKNIRIKKSLLTRKKIKRKYFKEIEDKFIISGIDGFKIVALKY